MRVSFFSDAWQQKLERLHDAIVVVIVQGEHGGKTLRIILTVFHADSDAGPREHLDIVVAIAESDDVLTEDMFFFHNPGQGGIFIDGVEMQFSIERVLPEPQADAGKEAPPAWVSR